ncbi:MAG: hypothetical protein OXM87_09555 [Truepera sp.]|nr:hypothetical protein [Truepera sp.]
MPPNKSATAPGDTRTALIACSTTIRALPDTAPEVAVTVAAPLLTAVTSPEALTVTTDGSLLAQVMVAPVMARPFWSRTSAVSSAVGGLIMTVVGRALAVKARPGCHRRRTRTPARAPLRALGSA